MLVTGSDNFCILYRKSPAKKLCRRGCSLGEGVPFKEAHSGKPMQTDVYQTSMKHLCMYTNLFLFVVPLHYADTAANPGMSEPQHGQCISSSLPCHIKMCMSSHTHAGDIINHTEAEVSDIV